MALEARPTSRGRIIRGTTETVQITVYVDGTATNATGTVTYSVARANGTVLTSGNASNNGTGVYEFTLPAQTDLNVFTVTWTGTWSGATQTVRTQVEVVGAHLFTEAQARAFDNGAMANTTTYQDADIAATRDQVTDLIESYTGISWVPRFKRRVLAGSGTDRLIVPERHLSSLLTASIDGTALTSTEVTAVTLDDGLLFRSSGSVWTAPANTPRNVTLEYEYGKAYPEDGVDRIALKWTRAMLVPSNIDDRASSFTDQAGQTYRYLNPGDRRPSGIPEVDAWLMAHSVGFAL